MLTSTKDADSGALAGAPGRQAASRTAGVLLLLIATLGLAATPNQPSQLPRLPLSWTPLHTIAAHPRGVTGIGFSPDRRRLASVGTDGRVRVWDVATGLQVLKIEAHRQEARCVRFSPDGALLASGSDDGLVKFWQACDGKRMGGCSGHTGGVRSITFSSDGKWLASVGFDGKANLWDGKTGQLVQILTQHDHAWTVAFASQGSRLAIGGHDGTVSLWDASTSRQLRTFTAHQAPVTSVGFGAGDRQIVSSSLDGTVRLADSEEGQTSLSVEGVIACLAPVGDCLAVGSPDGNVRGFEVGTGELQLSSNSHGKAVTCLAFDADGVILASGSRDGAVCLWQRGNPAAYELVTPKSQLPANDAAAANGQRAFLVVRLPGNASLAVDGLQTKQPGDVRPFRTPPLASGGQHTYRLDASWDDSGDHHHLERFVTVRAGQETQVDLRRPPHWPPFRSEPVGRNMLRVVNDHAYDVVVGLRCQEQGIDFTVPAGRWRQAFVSAGDFDIFFQYANSPDALYQGDRFTIEETGRSVTVAMFVLTLGEAGRYRIRRVRGPVRR